MQTAIQKSVVDQELAIHCERLRELRDTVPVDIDNPTKWFIDNSRHEDRTRYLFLWGALPMSDMRRIMDSVVLS